MSRGSKENRIDLMSEIARELRQFNGLGASFFRAAAARIGMTVTDMQVIDFLDSIGPMTAGQLADLTGLTTGAITGMLNRLEEVGLVRRERDPNDGRRVIVQLEKGKDEMNKVGSLFDSIEQVWDEIVSQYSEEQIAFLLEFLKRNNAVSIKEIVQLREGPSDEKGVFSAPLGDLKSAQFIVSSGVSTLILRTDKGMTDLYQARFEGSVPELKVKEGAVSIRYPKRLWVPGGGQRTANVTLSTAIPWQITIQGGASQIEASLDGLNLAGLEIKGGLSTIHLNLPVPSTMVPLKISGGASEIVIRRPAGVAARVHLKGWVSDFTFDDQTFSGMGSDARLQSRNYQVNAPCYDFEVSSSASMVTITSG